MPDQVEHLAGPRPPRGRRRPAQPQPELDVLQRGQVREEAVRLEDHPHVAPVGRHVRDVLAADQDPAGVGVLQPGEDPQRGGLAAAGRAEQRDQLARARCPGRARRGRVRRRSDGCSPSSRDRRHCSRGPSPSRRRVRRPRPTRDSRSSRTNASTSAASDTAMDIVALLLPSRSMATWRFWRLSSDAMVNSPSTRATVMNAADSTAERMFGSTTRHITVAQPAPRLRAASAQRAHVDRGQAGVDGPVGERQHEDRVREGEGQRGPAERSRRPTRTPAPGRPRARSPGWSAAAGR